MAVLFYLFGIRKLKKHGSDVYTFHRSHFAALPRKSDGLFKPVDLYAVEGRAKLPAFLLLGAKSESKAVKYE